jgi:hypothetical protein
MKTFKTHTKAQKQTQLKENLQNAQKIQKPKGNRHGGQLRESVRELGRECGN